MANQSEGVVRLWSTPSPGALERAEIDTDVISFSMTLGVKKRETVSLSGGAFTALTVPSGAKIVLVKVPTTAGAITLKGVTGDTGNAGDGSRGVPWLLPLGTTPSIGFLNAGAAVDAEVFWL